MCKKSAAESVFEIEDIRREILRHRRNKMYESVTSKFFDEVMADLLWHSSLAHDLVRMEEDEAIDLMDCVEVGEAHTFIIFLSTGVF